MEIVKAAKGNQKDICGSVERIDKFITRLYMDIKMLIRALEIYLAEFVGKIENNIVIPEITEMKIDHVLSFNYTNTFSIKYGEEKSIEYNYIHGEAKLTFGVLIRSSHIFNHRKLRFGKTYLCTDNFRNDRNHFRTAYRAGFSSAERVSTTILSTAGL